MKTHAFVKMESDGLYVAVYKNRKFGYTVPWIAQWIADEINTGKLDNRLGVHFTCYHKEQE